MQVEVHDVLQRQSRISAELVADLTSRLALAEAQTAVLSQQLQRLSVEVDQLRAAAEPAQPSSNSQDQEDRL